MKKITLSVLGVHLLLLLLFALAGPNPPPKKEPLVVKTVVISAQKLKVEEKKEVAAAPPAPAAPPEPKQIVQKKKKAAVPHIRPPVKRKSPKVSQELAKKLQQSIAKLDSQPTNTPSIKLLRGAKTIAKLAVEGGESVEADLYICALVDCLQKSLTLPESGTVKVALTLQSKGEFVKMEVLESGSVRNRDFLSSALKKVAYPRFSGTLAKEKEHTFVITFTH